MGHMVTKDKTDVLHTFVMHRVPQIAAFSRIREHSVGI